MTYRRAVTFGMRYRHETHPKISFAHPAGYIAVEAATLEEWYKFMELVVGFVPGSTEVLNYAFDYDLEKFEAEEAERADGRLAPGYRLYDHGRIAEFSALPIRVGSRLEGERR